MAAAGPHPVQPGAVDPHAGRGAGEAVLLPGDGLPGRRPHLRQREASEHSSADRSHAQVLLLGGEPALEERDHAEGVG